MIDLGLGTDAKCKFKQAFKHSPSRKRIPKHHLILKLKPFHFSNAERVYTPKMVLQWTKMLTVFVLLEHVKDRRSSSGTVTVPDIIKLQALDMWRLEVKWMMSQNEKQRNQTYEIQVGRTANMDVVDSMNVSRRSLEEVHTLVWTSQLPLNCVDHSVRIRLISDASQSSSWSSWKTVYGEMNLAHNEIRIFPNNQVLREGSTVMFCCIYPTETNLTKMFFGNTDYKVINISPQVKAIRVENIKATNAFGVIFYCERERDEQGHNFVSFPPEKPLDFRCKTEDMRHAYCFDSKSVKCDESTDPAPCRFDVIQQQIKYNITLLVTNSLGRESETDIFNITDRVPEHHEVTAGVFDSLDLDKNGSDSVQHYAFRLQHLKPSTQYSVRGRCAVQGNNWGRWTEKRLFITEPLVTINLWRHIRDHPTRTITLLWKTVSSESELYIEAYEVCVSYRNQERSVCMNITQTQVELTRDDNMSEITVRAVIQSGFTEAARTFPSAYTGDKPCPSVYFLVPSFCVTFCVTSDNSTVVTEADNQQREKRIMGNEKGFQLTWTKDSTTTCDYTVEWYMLGIKLPSNLQWRKVPANQTSLNLYAEPTQWPTLDTNPTITWSSVNLKWSFNEMDLSHAGFITGYMITVQDDSEASSGLSSISQSVDNPHVKSWTVTGLAEDQLYTFQLAAYYMVVVKVLVPLLVLFGCCVCLWSYRNLFRGFPEEPLGFLHIKALDLDEDLYEASEKLRTLMIDDCKWCDVEILEAQPAAEKTRLKDAEDQSSSFITPTVMLPSCHPTTDVWVATDLTNLTYVSCVQQDLPSEEQQTEATKQEISGFSSDYVTSVATSFPKM
ncbi:Leukemia inhibitory factor receptor [Labeo rohita]|uniref:Leukemia inhibitory factor receptor n=1 Tax=Labeo rohita TaxID=84645 RepID=A0ABQ8MQ74_LABRO|nr:Leukemia inhibitory factor receptor [Labeo rohita]